MKSISNETILQRQRSTPRLLARGRHHRPQRSGAGARYRRLSELERWVRQNALSRRPSVLTVRTTGNDFQAHQAHRGRRRGGAESERGEREQTASHMDGRGNWVQSMRTVCCMSAPVYLSFIILPVS